MFKEYYDRMLFTPAGYYLYVMHPLKMSELFSVLGCLKTGWISLRVFGAFDMVQVWVFEVNFVEEVGTCEYRWIFHHLPHFLSFRQLRYYSYV